jgi:hypothetical protein
MAGPSPAEEDRREAEALIKRLLEGLSVTEIEELLLDLFARARANYRVDAEEGT